jgi:hypothetical protein
MDSRQATVCWQWSEYLMRECREIDKQPLLLNLDETSVPVAFTHGKGNLMVNGGRDAWRAAGLKQFLKCGFAAGQCEAIDTSVAHADAPMHDPDARSSTDPAPGHVVPPPAAAETLVVEPSHVPSRRLRTKTSSAFEG